MNIPVVVSSDGKRHEPLPAGAGLPPSAIPLAPDRKNLLTSSEEGLLLTGADMVSELANNPLIENVDGKLYFKTRALLADGEKVLSVADNLLSSNLSLVYDPATAHLSLTGVGGSQVADVALPITPGLPTVVEMLYDTQPPLPEGYESNPYPVGTYLHMRFPMTEGEYKDIYTNMSTLVDGVGGVAIRLDGDALKLLGSSSEVLSEALMPYTDEELTAGELLTDFTPPPEHGQAQPRPKSDYLHLHFDSKRGEERDLYIDMAGITAAIPDDDGKIWGKRITTPLPTSPAAIAALTEDMPVGAFVYSTVGDIVFITQDEGDARYVRLSGNQTVTGVKTFAQSPIMPTPAANDNSTKGATTAFVQTALAGFTGNQEWVKRVDGELPTDSGELAALLQDMPVNGLVTYDSGNDITVFLTQAEADLRYVQLSAQQTITGVKTFAQSPLVPTPDANDNSTKAATTAFVQSLVASGNAGGGVSLSGDQTIGGTKTFLQSPVMPTPVASDNSTKGATTAFVQTVISGIDAAQVNAVPLAGDATVTGVKTFAGELHAQTPSPDDNSTKAATTAFVQGKISSLGGDEVITGVKTFQDAPLIPTAEFGDSSTQAANTEFVSRIVWTKVINTPLPTDDAAIAALVADMPVGAWLAYSENEEEEA